MIILDITIIAPGNEVGKKLGNPQTWTEESAAPQQPAMQPVQRSMPSPAPKPVARPTTGPNLDTSLMSSQMTHPIASLSPYQNKYEHDSQLKIKLYLLIKVLTTFPYCFQVGDQSSCDDQISDPYME